MNVADIRTGEPKIDGRYVAFVRCAAAQIADWVEPVIMNWRAGKWDTTFLQNKIIGHFGPIPPLKVDQLGKGKAEPMEYDL